MTVKEYENNLEQICSDIGDLAETLEMLFLSCDFFCQGEKYHKHFEQICQ